MGHGYRLVARIVLVLTIFLAVASAGCDMPAGLLDSVAAHGADEGSQETSDADVTVPDGTPEELATLLERAQYEAGEVARLLSHSNENHRLRVSRLTRHVNTGVAAAEKLVAHGDATPHHKQSAHKSKVTLLYQGAEHCPDVFLDRLDQYITHVRQDNTDGELAAIGDAALVKLKYLSENAPDEEVLPELISYAETYPTWNVGIGLFQQYGQQLESDDRREDAIQCYRTAMSYYGGFSEVETLRGRLANLENRKKVRKKRQSSREQELAAIRRQLGNREFGYFVIYANEVKPPSDKSTLYSFEYEVIRGINATASYIAGLRPNWQWKLEKHFPDTPAAGRQAQELAEKLTKKRAFIRY